jgi:hypothetical protein
LAVAGVRLAAADLGSETLSRAIDSFIRIAAAGVILGTLILELHNRNQ